MDDIEFLLEIPFRAFYRARWHAKSHPGYDTLRNHPRYKKIVTDKLNS